MGIEELKTMKTQLMSCVQGQMGDLRNTDTKELGEAIDMIKDLSEAIYYCTITESMEKAEKQQEQQPVNNNITYYTNPVPMYNYMTPRMYPEYRDMERKSGYMYYASGSGGGGGSGSGSGGSSGGSGGGGRGGSSGGGGRGGSSYYHEGIPYETMMPQEMMTPQERMMPQEMMRDPREGKAAIRRRMYMEGKEKNNDKTSQLRELEAYLKELSGDITEMIKDASPEERATLHQKMTTLASKIS